MHPRVFLDSFWRNDLKNEVFVAMSFAPKYDERWEKTFVPAIEGHPVEGLDLKAIRVDARKSGDSIISEINDGIAHAQLVLADVSVTDRWKEGEQERCCRNGNVMYEVGLALSCRQPVEVILVRDDSEPLLFDISQIPVLELNPHNQQQSVEVARHALQDRLKERSLLKDLRVQQILESLSQFEINLIRQNAHLEYLGWKGPSYPPAVGIALPMILQKRILRLVKLGDGEHPDAYTWTTLGKEVSQLLADARPVVSKRSPRTGGNQAGGQ
jgi:hypothetical protein